MKNLIYLLLASFIISACNNEQKENNKKDTVTLKDQAINVGDLSPGEKKVKIIADTIKYKAVVKDPGSPYFVPEWTEGFKKREFLNMIFDAVYNGRLKARDFYTNDVLTTDSVMKIEEKFPRDKIGVLFFEEAWYFDYKELKMYKKVKSIMFAYENFRPDSEFKENYAAGILIRLDE